MAAIWIPKRLVDLSLINTRAQSKRSFVRHCEFEYESRIYAAAKEIVAEDRHVVLVSGPSSSGKTTSSLKLRDKLIGMGRQSRVVSMDNFYKNLDVYPRLEDGSKDLENVTGLELDLFADCVRKLLADGKAMFPRFDFASETRQDEAEPIEIGDGILIVEGIHALNPLVLEKLPEDERFAIYASPREEYSYRGQKVLPTRDIRLMRRMIRDYKRRGNSPWNTIEVWPKVCEGEDKYIKVYKPNADYILDTSFSYELLIMNSELQNFKGYADDSIPGMRLGELLNIFKNLDSLSVGYVPRGSMLKEFYG
jgi:uridine kinase